MLPEDPIRMLSQLQPVLYAYILSLHPNRTDAEDILQETNVTIWKKLGDYEPGTNFRVWVCKIAYYQTLAERKRLSRRPQFHVLDEQLLNLLAEEAELRLANYEQKAGALKHCLAHLRSEDTRLLKRHYVDGFPLTKIAAELGRSAVALRGSMLRIRRALKSCIEGRVSPPSSPPSVSDVPR